MAARNSGLLKLVARLEDAWIGVDACTTPISRPIYVTGLARAGTTILLEKLAAHPDTASHLYRDYSFVLTPAAWNWFLDRAASPDGAPVERFHRDRLEVTPHSPEAMEEVVWMTFFPGCHDPMRSSVLDRDTDNPAFERFYRNHILKLLRVRGGRRYLAKGNYNLARLGYIAKMFPDAVFVVPMREPLSHVASLLKQHRLLGEAEARSPRVLNGMRRAGHFEFGLDRRPINFGDPAQAKRIRSLWSEGQESRGWAASWAAAYGYVLSLLSSDSDVAETSLVLRYEDLCDCPVETLRRLFAHCELSRDDDDLESAAADLSPPTYYSAADLVGAEDEVWDEVRDVAPEFGYRLGEREGRERQGPAD